jgi:hypothetical protein
VRSRFPNEQQSGTPRPTPQRESFTELLGQLAKHSAAVVRDEIELGIRRIREKGDGEPVVNALADIALAYSVNPFCDRVSRPKKSGKA